MLAFTSQQKHIRNGAATAGFWNGSILIQIGRLCYALSPARIVRTRE